MDPAGAADAAAQAAKQLEKCVEARAHLADAQSTASTSAPVWTLLPPLVAGLLSFPQRNLADGKQGGNGGNGTRVKASAKLALRAARWCEATVAEAVQLDLALGLGARAARHVAVPALDALLRSGGVSAARREGVALERLRLACHEAAALSARGDGGGACVRAAAAAGTAQLLRRRVHDADGGSAAVRGEAGGGKSAWHHVSAIIHPGNSASASSESTAAGGSAHGPAGRSLVLWSTLAVRTPAGCGPGQAAAIALAAALSAAAAPITCGMCALANNTASGGEDRTSSGPAVKLLSWLAAPDCIKARTTMEDSLSRLLKALKYARRDVASGGARPEVAATVTALLSSQEGPGTTCLRVF
ncbi:hypothetical protein JKP88DRAFT_347995, partial [Tribonema minus]